MKVFKFGGASIKDAKAVRNMVDIIENYHQEPLLVVVSAMGKTTNALELVQAAAWEKGDWKTEWEKRKMFHDEMMANLFADPEHEVFAVVDTLYFQLEEILQTAWEDFNAMYDAVVSFGEILSSTIIAHYINTRGIACKWLDARSVIKTDERFREAWISWDMTTQRIKMDVPMLLEEGMVLTQGFIGSTISGETTTLAREGSDFSAAIFANALDAESATIWKDVPGILNADPKRVANTVKFEEISYYEAAEMTFYGASVIHPKTIKPLADKEIPLLVKSFEHPEDEGTRIHRGLKTAPLPNIIFKDNQVMMTFKVRDLAFLNEENLSLIFHLLNRFNIKLNMLQNTALSLTVCFDNRLEKIQEVKEALEDQFIITFQEDLQLITLRNYTIPLVEEYAAAHEIIAEQKSRSVFQLLVRQLD
ncbi:aspartate kinase [Persicobacter sp. CCB-QB2]|uniref:aspartate kinase n=1 Tax=Persicobacter sp. CCB-QB2 TaxID=1561025 RepID=UPI0006A94FEA|nr:aspartate kinase [Persicobacter sp. CCB-QB2]